MHVLIVDDDPDQLHIRSMLLEQHGFQVTAVATGPEALDCAAATEYGAALLDIRLPKESDGLRLIRELKGLRPDLSLFVLTGSPPARLRQHPEMQLVRDVLVKGAPARNIISALSGLHSERVH